MKSVRPIDTLDLGATPTDANGAGQAAMVVQAPSSPRSSPLLGFR